MIMRAGNDIAHLCVFLFFFWTSFSLAAANLFGHTNDYFSTFESSFETLFFYSFGFNEFTYKELTDVYPIMAPLFLGLYLVLIVLVLFNTIIAVLMDAWAELRPNPNMQATLVDEIKEGVNRRLMGCQRRNYTDIEDLQRVLEELDHFKERQVSYEYLRERLVHPMTKRTDALVRNQSGIPIDFQQASPSPPSTPSDIPEFELNSPYSPGHAQVTVAIDQAERTPLKSIGKQVPDLVSPSRCPALSPYADAKPKHDTHASMQMLPVVRTPVQLRKDDTAPAPTVG